MVLYRVSHSGLASEDLFGRALGSTASHREDISNNYHLKSSFPIIITSKVFFQLVCVLRKIEICEEKMENDVKF
jgi:hypothetical protein